MTDRNQRFAESVNPEESEQEQQPQIVESPSRPKMIDRMHNKLGRLHLFASFCENPANVTFQTQEPDERVLLFLRKSQWINAPWIAMTIILALLPFGAYSLRGLMGTFIFPVNVFFVLVPLYYLMVVVYAFVNFVTWYYNAALITNKRIVDIDFHQIVLKDVAETKLTLVQDVSYKQSGVLPNVFGYGFVLVQTAGTLENFEFNNLPSPARVVEVVEELIGGKRIYGV